MLLAGATMSENQRHKACFDAWDECVLKELACPMVEVKRQRARYQARAWGALVLKREVGSWRHYLDGRPVRCGATLQLQTIEHRSDDYGEFSVFTPQGVPVRYEASALTDPKGLVVTLYHYAGGLVWRMPNAAVSSMRFRWPRSE